jgi:NADPH-ferrihemoprotein reductase
MGMAIEAAPASMSMAVVAITAVVLIISLIAGYFFFSSNLKDPASASPPSKAPPASATVVAAAEADPRERCTLLFGTQTGTAERFAKFLRSQLEGQFGSSTAFDAIALEHYDAPARLPKERLVLFLMATYGDGEPTDDAAEFYNWLGETSKEGADRALLSGVNYGVFGLGNRQYEHFCAVGKKVHDLMEHLGARPVVRRGDGDDDRDIDADFDSWTADLFAALSSSELVRINSTDDLASLAPSSVDAYAVEEVRDAPVDAVDALSCGSGLHHASPFLAKVLDLKELHAAGSDRSCIHVELGVTGSKITYQAGGTKCWFINVVVDLSIQSSASRCLSLPLS